MARLMKEAAAMMAAPSIAHPRKRVKRPATVRWKTTPSGVLDLQGFAPGMVEHHGGAASVETGAPFRPLKPRKAVSMTSSSRPKPILTP